MLIHRAAAGIGLFWWEDAQPMPWVHAAWHCLSAYGIHGLNAFLSDVEDRQAAAAAAAGGKAAANGSAANGAASNLGLMSAVVPLQP